MHGKSRIIYVFGIPGTSLNNQCEQICVTNCFIPLRRILTKLVIHAEVRLYKRYYIVYMYTKHNIGVPTTIIWLHIYYTRLILSSILYFVQQFNVIYPKETYLHTVRFYLVQLLLWYPSTTFPNNRGKQEYFLLIIRTSYE